MRRGAVRLEVFGVAVDHAAADIDLLQVSGDKIGRADRFEGLVVEAGRIRLVGDHLFQDVERHDVRKMRIRAIGVSRQGAEGQDVGFHRVRREDRHHLQAVHVVPGVEDQVPDVEEVGEALLLHAEQGGQFLGHGSPHQRSCKVADAPPRPHQRGNAGKVVVVGMGVKNAVHLVDGDAQRRQGMGNVRTRVDKVQAALEHDDARHAGTVGVPAVALARMDDGEVL